MRLAGKSVYKKTAMGEVVVLRKATTKVTKDKIENVNAELDRLTKAINQAKSELFNLYKKAVSTVGEEQAAIFEVHQMMLEDEDFINSIRQMIIEDHDNAAYAVSVTGQNVAKMFASMEDEYMKARAADIKDISERLELILTGANTEGYYLSKPSIIVANDLTPSETVSLDKKNILAFVTVEGSTNSHTAILARTMNIPALVCVPIDLSTLKNHTMAIVDGIAGEVIFNPSDKEIEDAMQRIASEKETEYLLQALKGKDSCTKSGHQIHVYANIGNTSDVEYVLQNDAEGIGLFRSEFLYLGRDRFPTEEEQFASYREVLSKMGEKKVIIRTLDLGADKQVDYFHLGHEENPALGYRAIRICLKQKDIFRTQLRALLRASSYGNLAIMYPMITSVEELKEIYEFIKEVREELEGEGIFVKMPEQGIMIETPAAVMISDELAELADFFSIGTNDLTQYTLAIDRQNQKLEDFYRPHHKAIFRMIQMVIDHAHEKGKWVGICGELGADLTLTEKFVAMGIDELSVSPSMVLKIRNQIRNID